LSGIETRACKRADSWLVTGHKTWVAAADTATHAVVLCRSSNGLIRVVVPLADNHVEIRAIRDLSGANRLFDLVFDGSLAALCDTDAPLDGIEPEFAQEFWELVESARSNGRASDRLVRQQLAWAYAQIQIIQHLPNSPVRQLLAAEYHRRFGEIAIDLTGSDALLRTEAEGYVPNRWQQVFLTSRGDTLARRTTELLRTRIAEDLLGLPPDRDACLPADVSAIRATAGPGPRTDGTAEPEAIDGELTRRIVQPDLGARTPMQRVADEVSTYEARSE
jgi:alkylation response protein AidB-like acyl-CoA dehydrogenase